MRAKSGIILICILLFCCSIANAENKRQVVQGIFYSKDNPRVMVSGKIYAVGDIISGFQIVAITPEAITVKSAFEEYKYHSGETLRPEGTIRVLPQDAPQAVEYLRTIRLLVNKLPDIRQPAPAIGAMLKELKQRISRVNVPSSYTRYHLLVLKLFDISEEAWLPAVKGNRSRAKILLSRVERIRQELNKQFALLSH